MVNGKTAHVYVGWREKRVCKDNDDTQTEAIPALGHDTVDHEAKVATA